MKNNKPILIYGNAQHAIDILHFLQRNNVPVESFVVDDYVSLDTENIKGVPVRSINAYIQNLEKFAIVIGFCNIEKSRVLLSTTQLMRCRVYRIWEPTVFFDLSDEFWEEHRREFELVYERLYDLKSKNVLAALIKARRNGLADECLKLAEDKQYFNELTFEVEPEAEVYIDCGAFNGDTVVKYAEFTSNGYQKIYAFEPDRGNMLLLRERVDDLHDVTLINKGTWACDAELSFRSSSSASYVDEKGTACISVTSIDKVLHGDKAKFIKMDVEGSEYQTLLGASQTLYKWMPKLAICVYHRADDIIKIIDFLNNIHTDEKEYMFFMKHHSK